MVCTEILPPSTGRSRFTTAPVILSFVCDESMSDTRVAKELILVINQHAYWQDWEASHLRFLFLQWCAISHATGATMLERIAFIAS